MNKLLQAVINESELFGSRAWGGSTDDSDWDYITSMLYIVDIRTLLNSDPEVENIICSEYDNNVLANKESVKFRYRGKIYNFIFYEPENLWISKSVNSLMYKIKDVEVFHKRVSNNKSIRIKFCEMYFDTLNPLDLDVNTDTYPSVPWGTH